MKKITIKQSSQLAFICICIYTVSLISLRLAELINSIHLLWYWPFFSTLSGFFYILVNYTIIGTFDKIGILLFIIGLLLNQKAILKPAIISIVIICIGLIYYILNSFSDVTLLFNSNVIGRIGSIIFWYIIDYSPVLIVLLAVLKFQQFKQYKTIISNTIFCMIVGIAFIIPFILKGFYYGDNYEFFKSFRHPIILFSSIYDSIFYCGGLLLLTNTFRKDKIEKINEKDRIDVLTIGDWIKIYLLLLIPIANIILLFSWAFAGRTNYDKSNWAKAVLLWSAGGSLISAVGTIFYIAWGYSRLGYFYY